MFPAYAGMNRDEGGGGTSFPYVPRICGDEPEVGKMNKHSYKCSPHMRG